MTKLDYTITSPEERNKIVQEILAENPNPNAKYLEVLADYLVFCMEKEEKKRAGSLTPNRMATINKRETSLEGLVSDLENGEDGIYALINENKHTILTPKVSITEKDLEDIPPLRETRQSIEFWENKLKHSTGKTAFAIKKTIIEFRKDQYAIKNSWRNPIQVHKITKSRAIADLEETNVLNEEGYVDATGVSLINPEAVSAILCNYSKLKQDSYDDFEGELWYLLVDFDLLAEEALAPYPLYERLVELKIDGRQNIDIQTTLQLEFGIKHSLEYISSLWRNKIPKIIASYAEDKYLEWYYTFKEKGKFKKCSRCGDIKLAHNKYFSRNKTSKDGFYSICKVCRNKKGAE